MKNSFIIKWRNLSRNERKKIIHDFIATKKMRAKATVKKSIDRPAIRRPYDRKRTVFNKFRVVRVIKPSLVFSFSSPSDPAGGGDDISGPTGDQDSPTSNKSPEYKPSGRRPLNFQNNSERKKTTDSAVRRQQQKQMLIEFIKQLREREWQEDARRRQAYEAARLAKVEAKKQAELKAEASRLARVEAKKIRRQQLLREKIEKAQKRKAQEQIKKERAEQERKRLEERRQSIKEAKEKALAEKSARRQQRQRLVEFIKQLREREWQEDARRRQAYEAARLAKVEAKKQAELKAEASRLARVEAEKIRRQLKVQKITPVRPEPALKPEPQDLRPQNKEKLVAFLKLLKEKNQAALTKKRIEKEAILKQRKIAALAAMQERQAKAAQAAEFKARQRQLAIQKKELLKAEFVLAAKKKQEEAALEKSRRETEKQIQEISSKIKGSASNLEKLSTSILASANTSVAAAVKKASGIKVPQASVFAVPTEMIPAQVATAKAPARPEKPKKYREPVKIGPLLRRNAFRILFFLLLLMWLGEILFYTMRWKPPRERFEEMYGSTEKLSSEKQVTAQLPEEEKEIEYSIPAVNIEGRRDPFSGGLLTMELMKKPKQAEIMFAYKPEIITIMKKTSIIPPPVEKPVRERPEKITPILKPEMPETRVTSISEATVSKILPPSPVSKPEISPLIVPQVECPLVYRGSLIMEGIEYIFIEGKQRTYRVTVGDVVEGFRILKKGKGVLTLSRDGMIIDIPAE
ncbi:MAG: hypothetical protein NC831_08390 [Candidatus Omnitrophica bacterium]|nr:hypothetical protein [Candidatus Omnitrophota bacterium]